MAERDSCAWCGAGLPSPASVGRPREYCSRSCRQRAYEHRHVGAGVDVAEQVVVVRRDRLDALCAAAEDADSALAARLPRPELERACRELVHTAGALTREWAAARERVS